jgi:hypothetical protein
MLLIKKGGIDSNTYCSCGEFIVILLWGIARTHDQWKVNILHYIEFVLTVNKLDKEFKEFLKKLCNFKFKANGYYICI